MAAPTAVSLEDLLEGGLGGLEDVSVAEGIRWALRGLGTYVHDGDGLLAGRTEVLDHVLDEHGALGDLAL
jgi:hypothetical protein